MFRNNKTVSVSAWDREYYATLARRKTFAAAGVAAADAAAHFDAAAVVSGLQNVTQKVFNAELRSAPLTPHESWLPSSSSSSSTPSSSSSSPLSSSLQSHELISKFTLVDATTQVTLGTVYFDR
jgi:hypothetical protein